jgi:large subunit ribosomal protein L13
MVIFEGDMLGMKTQVVNTKSIERAWYVVDASDQVLGRLASTVANLLIGKTKPSYSPNQDHGDNVVVINADKVKVTGNKAEDKTYFRHSKYPGGGKFRTFNEQLELDSTKIIQHAVKGMCPKNALGRQIVSKLHVYAGGEHQHAAQKPVAFDLH